MSNANAANKTTTRLPPALNPEQPALTQPWRDFVSRGFVTSLKVEFSGGMTNVLFEVGPQVVTPDGVNRTKLPAGAVKHYIIESKLWSPVVTQRTKAGTKEGGVQLPKKSLVPGDFSDKTSDQDLLARTTAVAEALTDTVARGRIGSLKFMRKGIDSFEQWWRVAPPAAKTRIVMDGRHHTALAVADHARFARVVGSCPFRGPVPTPTEEEEAEAKQGQASNGKQLTDGEPSSPPRK